MRKHLHINLGDRSVKTDELHGEAIIRAGRYFIAKSLLASGAAKVDPLSPDNPLIFSAGPFAGTNFSNANRLSVGCKSPLTGGIKEANAGGTFAFALGQLEIAGITLTGASKDWTLIRITKEGEITYESAEPYMGKGNFEVGAMLWHRAPGRPASDNGRLCHRAGGHDGGGRCRRAFMLTTLPVNYITWRRRRFIRSRSVHQDPAATLSKISAGCACGSKTDTPAAPSLYTTWPSCRVFYAQSISPAVVTACPA